MPDFLIARNGDQLVAEIEDRARYAGIESLFLLTTTALRSNDYGRSPRDNHRMGRFLGFSAGSHPGAKVKPLAIERIKPTGYPAGCLRSKSWGKFAVPHTFVCNLL